MPCPLLENRVRYVTNLAGETTDVLVWVDLWQQIIYTLEDPASGLALVDEQEPKAQILASLQESLKQAALGQTYSVSQLWDNIEA